MCTLSSTFSICDSEIDIMKCSKCGVVNGKTNKFCRECGTRLKEPVDQTVSQIEDSVASIGDVSLGEELSAVWQLYEEGKLASALTDVQKIIASYPESTSARSILALIYERKAQKEIESGYTQAGQDFLKLALEQYEKIIDLNPDSTADREKLVSIRARLGVGDAKQPDTASSAIRYVTDLKKAFKAIPVPYIAAAGAFFFVLMLLIIIWPSSDKDSGKSSPAHLSSSPAEMNLPSVPNTSSGSNTGAGLSIYEFPAVTQPQTRPQASSVGSSGMAPPSLPSTDNSALKSKQEQEDVEPLKLPSMGSELTIAPEQVDKPIESTNNKDTDGKGGAASTPADSTAPASVHEAAPQVSGTSMIAKAIQLHDQGNVKDAINAAENAILLFQSEAQAGKNVDLANRGADNARKLIALWRKSSQ